MPDLSGRELLHEWQRLMESVLATASSAASRAEMPRQLTELTQRQLELMREVIDREQRLQRDIATRLTAPVDAVFDLLEDSTAMLRGQAEALEAAGAALQESAQLMQRQAELFARTVATLRKPTELAQTVAGVEKRPRPRRGRNG